MMPSPRETFLSSLVAGDVVHFVVEVGGDATRLDAVVAKVGVRGFVVVTGSLREVRLDSYGYAPKSHSTRIEPAEGMSGADWTAARRRMEKSQRLARVGRRLTVGANSGEWAA